MFVRTAISTVLVVGLFSVSGFAQSPQAQERQQTRTGRPAGIEARQRAQMNRIRQGHQRGVIDAAEQQRLLAMERRIQSLKQQLRASGSTLTRRERLRLQQQLNRADRAIRRASR